MMTLFKFESLKYFKNYKNLGIIFLIFISCFIFLLNTQKIENNLKKEYIKNIELNYNSLFLISNQWSQQLDMDPSNKEIEAKVDLYSTAISELEKEHTYLTENVWKKGLQSRINYLISIEKLMKLGENNALYNIPENIANDILHSQVLLKNQIKPFIKTGSSQGFYFMKSLMDILTTIFGTIIIALLFFDFFAIEFETKTRFLLFTQPFKRNYFFITKLKVAFSVIIGGSLSFLLSFFLFGSQLSLSTGRLDYPVAVKGGTLDSVSQFKLYYYLGIQFLFWILIICFSILLLYYLSLIIKNSISVLLTFICLMVTPYYFVDILSNQYPILKLTPFYYLSLSEKLISAYIDTNFYSFVLIGIGSLLIHCFLLSYLIKINQNKLF